MGIGIVFGLIVGAILYPFYDFQSGEFYEDKHFFEVPEEEVIIEKPTHHTYQRNKLPPIDETYKGSEIVLETSN